MAEKQLAYRYDMKKLRHCYPMYMALPKHCHLPVEMHQNACFLALSSNFWEWQSKP